MKRFAAVMCIGLASLVFTATVWGHCQVPCGIYGDQLRFETMLEDTKTIAKGMDQINGLAKRSDALSKNQLPRWVATKESHASNIQKRTYPYDRGMGG